MKYVLLLLLVVMTADLDLCKCSAVQRRNETTGPDNRRTYIANGVDATPCTFKHMAVIAGTPAGGNLSAPVSQYCGGVLIASDFVLTARHCLQMNAPWRVSLGRYDLSDSEEEAQNFLVTDAFTPPDSNADIALLRLNGQAIINECVEPARISTDLPSVGTELYVTGWGMTDSEIPRPGVILQRLSLPRADNAICRESFDEIDGDANEIILEDDTEFCAGRHESTLPYENICENDSGSPIHSIINNEFHVVGIAIEGMNTGPGGCPRAGHYAVYRKLADVADWVFQVTSVLAITPQPQPQREDRDDDDGCFPPSATVEMSSGEHVAISDIRPGDSILSMDSSGALVFSDVVTIMHALKSKDLHYLTITTQDKAVTLTPQHLIYRSTDCFLSSSDNSDYVYAEDVAVGDCVFVRSDNSSGDIKTQMQQVTDISVKQLDDAYAPLTAQGTIVVDGVVASCYAYTKHHMLGQLVYAPLRYMYSWMAQPLDLPAGSSDMLEFSSYTSYMIKLAMPIADYFHSIF